jgi:DNA-binding NtrC family response regulator
MKRKPTVLVVDDYENQLRFARDILEPDFDVDTASTYQEALEKLRNTRKGPYDVAVLDIRLNDSDETDERGLELLGEIENLGGYTQGIMWTGYQTFDTMRNALKNLSAFDYLLKKPKRDTGSLDVRLSKTVQEAAERARKLKGHLVPYSKKILLVEPQSDWSKRILSSLSVDYDVTLAENYADALKLLKCHSFRLVVVGFNAQEDWESQDAFDFLADAKDRSHNLDIILMSPFDVKINRFAQAINRHGVLDVFPKSEPFDGSRFGELIVHALSASTEKYIVAMLKGLERNQAFMTERRYELEIRATSTKPEGKDIVYTSFPMSPAQEPLDLLVRLNSYDMDVYTASERNLEVEFEGDTDALSFEFSFVRSGEKNLTVDFYVLPQLRWLCDILIPIRVLGA